MDRARPVDSSRTVDTYSHLVPGGNEATVDRLDGLENATLRNPPGNSRLKRREKGLKSKRKPVGAASWDLDFVHHTKLHVIFPFLFDF